MRHSAQRVLSVIAASLAFAAAPSHAQVAGTYVAGVPGTAGSFEIIVQSFDGGATLTVTQYSIDADLKCPSGAVHNENWGFGVWTPATSHVEDLRTQESLYTHLVGDFSADGSTFTGTYNFNLPLFVDLANSPSKAEVCKSGTKHVVATLQPASLASIAAKPPVLEAGQAMQLAR